MKVVDRGIVIKSEPDSSRQSCAFSALCIMPSGRWLCSLRAAPLKKPQDGQHVLFSWSDDEGKSWSKPISPFPPTIVNGNPGLIRGANMTPLGGKKVVASLFWVDNSVPGLPLFNEETSGLLDATILISYSEDDGETWSKPEPFDISPYKMPVSMTGPFLNLKNNEFVCQFETNKEYNSAEEWRHKPVLVFSKDMGKTSHRYVVPVHDPDNRIFYWDQRASVLNDEKTILAFHWPFDTQTNTFLNAYACESKDFGLTWSEAWDTGVDGQAFFPVQLNDERIVMAYVERRGTPLIKIRTSSDMGRTWPESTEVIIFGNEIGKQSAEANSMAESWREQFKFSVGFPCADVMANGDIVVVFYAGKQPDLTDIHWARISETK